MRYRKGASQALGTQEYPRQAYGEAGGCSWKVSLGGRKEQISDNDHTEFLTNDSLVSRVYEDRKSGTGEGTGQGHCSKHSQAIFRTLKNYV